MLGPRSAAAADAASSILLLHRPATSPAHRARSRSQSRINRRCSEHEGVVSQRRWNETGPSPRRVSTSVQYTNIQITPAFPSPLHLDDETRSPKTIESISSTNITSFTIQYIHSRQVTSYCSICRAIISSKPRVSSSRWLCAVFIDSN